jgi:hypothetical protein
MAGAANQTGGMGPNLPFTPPSGSPSPTSAAPARATGASPRSAAIDRALRLRTLWLAYLLAMLFHVDLGLMPLFHGVSPQIESQLPEVWLGALFWAMLLYFLLPLGCVLRIAWAASEPQRPGGWRRWRRSHFLISLLYTATNIPHLLADILIPDSRGDQVALMGVLLLIGVLINWEGWAWWREAGEGEPQLRRSQGGAPQNQSPRSSRRGSKAPSGPTSPRSI